MHTSSLLLYEIMSATGSYSCTGVSRDAFLSSFTIAIKSLEISKKKKKERKEKRKRALS